MALTPLHIWVGWPLTMLPEQNFSPVSENRLSSWEAVTKARQNFWPSCQSEYLTEWQRRWKGQTPKPALKVNDVVIFIDKNLLCMLGRVTAIHPNSSDGEVRVVSVQTANGILKRNSRSLCSLPVLWTCRTVTLTLERLCDSNWVGSSTVNFIFLFF